MNDFIENLKREANANPTMALGVAAAVIAATAKLVDAVGSTRSKRAYAKMAEQAVKRATKK
jgi:hypothetical protein